jgi:hypothetical protein
MSKLNEDQQKALNFIIKWFKGPEKVAILAGPGGVGKSFLVDAVLTSLKCSPLLLAPTHEALKQVRDKVKGDFPFRTVHSSLGVAPTLSDKEIKFEHIKLPKLWQDINFAVVDEASMLHDWMLDLFTETGVKILYVGHKSQLPPVIQNRKIFDKCISPVFERKYPTVSLKTPMRNGGKLWDFTVKLEELIYTQTKDIPNTFDTRKSEIKEYVHSKEGKEHFLNGQSKIILWTNEGVKKYNQKIRKVVFGDKALYHTYIPGDKIILTRPLTVIEKLEQFNGKTLKSLNKDAEGLKYVYSNTKATIKKVNEVEIHLEKDLVVSCYKLLVETETGDIWIYEPKTTSAFAELESYYERIAFSKAKKQDRDKAFKDKHFICSCFASCLHFYAATSHRLQGSSIEHGIVIDQDIRKNPNPIEQAKCRYVACSRMMKWLMFYRGL